MSSKDRPVKHSGDRKFKEIRREVNRKQQQNKNANVVHEYYVDSSRMISVELGGEGDLKNQMHETMKKWGADVGHNEHHDYNVVKLAEHYMKKGLNGAALMALTELLSLPHPSIASKVTISKCYLNMANWSSALETAEIVLQQDRRNIKAILFKAEALFNLCNFEHSLVLFHRGLFLAPDMDEFRLGVQKCQKTIHDGVGNEGIFQIDGLDALFRIFVGIENDKAEAFSRASGQDSKFDYSLANIKLESTINSQDLKSVESKPFEVKRASKCDRLGEDKKYLAMLASGEMIKKDRECGKLNQFVKITANEALEFLRSREAFWDQLDLGHEHRQSKSTSKALKSYRWIM